MHMRTWIIGKGNNLNIRPLFYFYASWQDSMNSQWHVMIGQWNIHMFILHTCEAHDVCPGAEAEVNPCWQWPIDIPNSLSTPQVNRDKYKNESQNVQLAWYNDEQCACKKSDHQCSHGMKILSCLLHAVSLSFRGVSSKGQRPLTRTWQILGCRAEISDGSSQSSWSGDKMFLEQCVGTMDSLHNKRMVKMTLMKGIETIG